jgi:hypothetical protein
MTHATIRVRVPSGCVRTFEAESVMIEHGLVTACGYWRRDDEQRRRQYTWPRDRVLEIGWRSAHVA